MPAKVNAVKEEALNLMCGDVDLWTWGGTDGSCRLTFHIDGTGTVRHFFCDGAGLASLHMCTRDTRPNVLQISCGENQRDWFAVETNWSFTEEPVRVNISTWKLTIQMALTTRIAPWYHDKNPWLTGGALQNHLQNPPPPSKAPFPWAPLCSTAFSSKQYTLTLSRGRFIEPFQHFIKTAYPLFQIGNHGTNRFRPNRYASQLAFDISPYPPREEWAEPWEYGTLSLSLDFHRHWEKREFVRDAIAKWDETWAETLDLRWWLSPAVGDAYKRGMT